MSNYLDEPLVCESKRLDLGIGVEDLARGVISLNVYSSGYTRSQLFEAIHKAQALVKGELDPNDEAWNHFKDLERQRLERKKEKA
ncbi:MAG TPA: hypothetical protein P5107_10550 [Thermotogota bacterium]|nr:hypothetical protein [Thermotogota bacterium]